MRKLPESDDQALCWIVEGPITREDYDHKFLPAFHEIIDKRGALYMVVVFHAYEGWDEEAMLSDLQTHMQHGANIARVAHVNAPESFQLKMKVMSDYTAGEVRYYDEDEYEKAANWVKCGDQDAVAE